MRNTQHLGAAKNDSARNSLVLNLFFLLLLLCLTGLTVACGAASQNANASNGASGSQTSPVGQLRVSIPPAQATVGVAYNAVSSVGGGTAPYLFGIADGSLPPGLVLNSRTGSITGTPSAAGTYNFLIYV